MAAARGRPAKNRQLRYRGGFVGRPGRFGPKGAANFCDRHGKNLLRDRTPTLPVADMRQVVAAVDDRPRDAGVGCTLSKADAAAGGRGESYGPIPAITAHLRDTGNWRKS